MATNNKPGTVAAEKKKSGRKAFIIILGVAVILVAAFAVTAWLAVSYNNIYPNIYVGDLSVGNMTVEEASTTIEASLADLAPVENMTIKCLDETFFIDAQEVEQSRNAESLALSAYDLGRNGGLIQKMLHRYGLTGVEIVSDAIFINTDYLRQLLGDMLAEKSDGSYTVDNNKLIITIGIDGVSADLDKAVSEISQRYIDGDYSVYTVDAVLDKAQTPDLQEIYDKECTSATDAYYDVETHQVIAQVDGYGFDLDATEKAVASASPGETVYFFFKTLTPQISSDDVWDTLFENELYSCTTSLAYNPNRTVNVTLAANAMNGTIVMPGDTFSFNKTVGERTSKKGYKVADVYVSGNTVGELGGGVCQVASTLYVCSLYTNLEIVERTEHQFYVTYVPSGLDATIYWGQLDYKFKNNTDYPIKIESGVDGSNLTVTLKGQKSNDNYVEMVSETLAVKPFAIIEEVDETKEPGYSAVKQTGYTGYTVRTTRNVYDSSGDLLESTLEAVSYYNRRDKIFIVGPEEVVPPVDETPVDETPVDETPGQETVTPVPETPTEGTSGQVTPTEGTP